MQALGLIAAALAVLVVVRPAAAQPGEAHRDLPRYAGTWTGRGGGWELTLEITRTPITPSRSLVRIALACSDPSGALLAEHRVYGHIVDARMLDLLVPLGDGRVPLMRIWGTVPDLAIARVTGVAPCAARAELPLTRAD